MASRSISPRTSRLPAHALAALVLLSGCYLGADTVSTRDGGGSMLDGGADLDARAPVDARADATSPSDATRPFEAGCVVNTACPASAPICSAGTCVGCKQPADCARFPSTAACAASGACVTCTTDQKSLCTGDAGVCDNASNQCVECLSAADCPSDMAAACKSDHACGLCTDDSNCTRFNKVCNKSSGACVQCRPDTEKSSCRSDKSCDPGKAECPGTACDPNKFSCTDKTRNTVITCQPCVSDSECVTGDRCIDMQFGSANTSMDLGGHCLQAVADAGCAPPLAKSISRKSVSGAASSAYCGLDETISSCAAISALRNAQACADAKACAAPGALCNTVNGVAHNTCTVACNSGFDCPSFAPCGVSSPSYCGGP